MPFPALRQPGRRLASELLLLAALGLIMGSLAPFGTHVLGALSAHAYWLICIVGGGAIGIGVDALVARVVTDRWKRLPVTVLVMTPFVTALVWLVNSGFQGQLQGLPMPLTLAWNVAVVSLLVMAARTLVWRPPQRVVETRTVIAPVLPENEAAFRRRLSAKRRAARLIAVEADDHYLKVHTDAGEELVTARFADALAELEQAHGWRTHRSWWVAADAVEAVRWRKGVGEATLAGGITAPVSRTYAPVLKEAGWF